MLAIFARRHPLEKSWFKFQNFEQSLYDLTGHSVSSRPGSVADNIISDPGLLALRSLLLEEIMGWEKDGACSVEGAKRIARDFNYALSSFRRNARRMGSDAPARGLKRSVSAANGLARAIELLAQLIAKNKLKVSDPIVEWT